MPSIEIEDVRREVERGDCKEKKRSRLGLRSYTHGQWSVRMNLNLPGYKNQQTPSFFSLRKFTSRVDIWGLSVDN